VGVWLGNFDGTPARALVGGERAGPVLFDMLDALTNREMAAETASPPGDLVEVEVCALSGRLASAHCPRRRKQLAPVRNLPTTECEMHQVVDVDIETGHSLCPVCRAGRPHNRRTYTVLPAAVGRWISDRQLISRRPPAHFPDCPQVRDSSRLRISQPQDGTVVYLVDNLDPARQEIPLEVEGDGRVGEVYWFVNGRLLARAPPDQRVWLRPAEGEVEIRAVGEAGLGDRIRIRVQAL
jgi:penicillin-binding protein 1C